MRWKHRWREILLGLRHHLFKGSAFVNTAVIFGLVAVFKPKWLTYGFDVALDGIKWVGSVINLVAPEWGDSFEAGLRFINFERIILFGMAVAVVKQIMLAAGWIFRRCCRGLRAGGRRLSRRYRNRTGNRK